MKLFHLTHYKFFNVHADGVRIFVASDIHFSNQTKNEKLNNLIRFAKKQKPNYILIPGDLVDSNDMVTTEKEQNRLLRFLQNFAEVAPVMLSLGNHDFYKKSGKTSALKQDWQMLEKPTLYDKIAAVPGVHLLDDTAYEDDKVYILGFTQQPKYYNFNFAGENRTSLFNPAEEDLDEMLRELDDLDPKLLMDLPKKKLKIALVHSPVWLHEYRVQAEFAEFDYIVSGHMHNGVVPPVVDELWRSTKGFVSPGRKLFARNIRNTIRTNEDKSIVVGAVTTFHECVGAVHYLNALYPSYTALLEFSRDQKYARKPDVSRKCYQP